MAALHTIEDILRATGGRAENVAATEIGSISIDSREIEPGALFVAIKGETFDGHDFAAKAVAAGAAAALVSEKRAGGLAGLPLIVVPDALDGLYGLARFARERSRARIVAVTGSVGKTSTKEAIRQVLSAAGQTHASIKSFNNHWGVPLMLARMPASAQFGVFEIGMSAAGEITPLTRLVRPHAAVVTSVAPAHLAFFDSVAAIAEAKSEIFSGLEPDGIAIIGHDHEHVGHLVRRAEECGASALTYGFDERADVRIEDYHAVAGGGAAHIVGNGLAVDLRVRTPGRHMLANAVAALLVARAFDVDLGTVTRTLGTIGAPEGRGAMTRLGPPEHPLTLIDESYNANPASMRAALDVFSQIDAHGGRRILVLGDMRELGSTSRELHAELYLDVIAAEPDGVFLVGEEMKALADKLPTRLVLDVVPNVAAVIPRVIETLALGDSVMVKGSNGLRLAALVAEIRRQFDV